MEEAGISPSSLLLRHLNGDWGDLSPEDRAENELSVREGYRVLSSYLLSTGQKIWLITEASRELTTFLRPDQY
jgi:hypothetical protein